MASKQADALEEGGPGVGLQKIASIEKAISKYERKKEERCKASPGEIAAKQELQKELHDHRKELPTKDGIPFYRSDDRDYFLEEVLKVKKVEAGEQ